MAPRKILTLITVFLLSSIHFSQPISAAPAITGITDNRSQYPNGSVPLYSKLEITFSLSNTTFENPYLPFTTSPPPGIASGKGITVTGIFTSPDGQVYNQPGFYYQEFADQVKSNKEWFYPTGTHTWKVRFSPNIAGVWKYKINTQDAGGTVESSLANFTVNPSIKHGFLQISQNDPRYFEYDDGAYFPGLGFNLNAGNLDLKNPILGNTFEFDGMGSNGIQLSRFWLQQSYMFAAAWSPYRSHNVLHQSQEPNPRLTYQNEPNFKTAYPSLTMPPASSGSEVYFWLNADDAPGSNPFNYTPCLAFGPNVAQVPAKRNTNYRIRVRFRALDMTGPEIAGKPYGFAVKHNGWLWDENDPSKNCYYPEAGNVVAASYAGTNWSTSPDPQNSGWSILQGTINPGDKDFFDYLYFTVENATRGHVFFDYVWLEENLGNNQYGPNLIYKPWAAQHYYFNQRNSYAFDKALTYAEKTGLTFKPVILEKNDILFRYFEFDGSLSSTPYSQNDDLFYGNGREDSGKTKIRFLHQAWWRYLQARWGYSPSIHSWELLNEGPPGNNEGHWTLTDEFGKYMKCEVFDVPAGTDCTLNHPNAHLITTSVWGQGYPFHFWNNTDGIYPDVDYADQHDYIETTHPDWDDEAQATYTLSTQRSPFLSNGANNPAGVNKPFIRGETAFKFDGTDLFGQNVTNGLWLHNFIWGGINYGGLMEQYWIEAPGKWHIYKFEKTVSWDHRPIFKTYYDFIKNVPLNKGGYLDAAPTVSNTNLRVWGQKHPAGNRAHLWIQNKNHTWKNIADGLTIPNQSGIITISGLSPNKSTKIEWWNTYSGTIASTSNITTNASGQLTLSVNNLQDDLAVKIGDYISIPSPSTTPSPAFKTGDVNHDGLVNVNDLKKVLVNFDKLPSLVSNYFDPVADIKINILDGGWVIKDWLQ